jgi:hypothetical protein
MKTKIIQIILLVSWWSNAWAQPANDDCANAFQLGFANSEAEAILGNGDTRGATASTSPSTVCSQTFYTDDVWYKFTTPSILPDGGIIIKAYFDNLANPTDLPHVGMAVYAGCGIDEVLVSCYVDDDPERNKTELHTTCLAADQEYLVRIWSGGADTTTEGTFRIGVFAGPPITHILWWETFGGGLEANGWTTEGSCANADSNLNAGWKYLPEGLLDQGAYLFDGAAISSPTLCDGAVGVDSDFDDNGGIEGNFGGGPCPAPAQHILISPVIDASAWPPFNLFLSWNQAIRQHQSTFIFSFRTRDGIEDWSDWIDFQVNTEFVSGGDFFNTDVQRHSLPGASGHDLLQLRFIYNANYYVWGIDDIRIMVNEYCTDLSINPRKCAIAPFAILPTDQVYPFPGSAHVSNEGICTQPSSIIELTIEDLSTNEIVYSNEITNGALNPGDNFFSLFPTLVNFPSTTGEFKGVYSITTETEDERPYDNSFDFDFNLGGEVFALEDGFTRSVAVAEGVYDKGAPLSYAYGNYFRPFTTTCADRIVWGVNNPDDMKDYTVQVYLLEWSDLNQNQIAESNERKFVGFDDYTFSGNEGENAIIETSLENFESPGSPIMMEAGLGYIAIIEYQATSEDDPQLFLLASEARDYTGQQIASDSAFAQGLIEKPTYFSVLGFSPDGDISNIDYEVKELDPFDDRIFFGNDIVPLVRVVTNEKGCLDGLEKLSTSEKISVFPNPANESMHVKLEFTKQHHGVQINLLNSLGQHLQTRTLDSPELNHTEKFDVRDLAAGSYHLQVETAEGQRTIPVIILH